MFSKVSDQLIHLSRIGGVTDEGAAQHLRARLHLGPHNFLHSQLLESFTLVPSIARIGRRNGHLGGSPAVGSLIATLMGELQCVPATRAADAGGRLDWPMVWAHMLHRINISAKCS